MLNRNALKRAAAALVLGAGMALAPLPTAALVGLILLSATPCPAGAQSSYQVMVFPTLEGYSSSRVQAANDTGAVVGSCQTGGGPIRSWYWRDTNVNGTPDAAELVDLGALAPAGTRHTFVRGINASDQVVGYWERDESGTPVERAFTWKPGDSALNELAGLVDGLDPGTWVDRVHAINDSGVIAGRIRGVAGTGLPLSAVLLHPNGQGRYTAQILYSSTSTSAEAHSLTENGLALIANSGAPAGPDLLWDGATLQNPGLDSAVSVNSLGHLAGVLNGVPVFKTSFAGEATTIGLFGGHQTQLTGMNDSDTVIGYASYYSRPFTLIFDPFRWKPGGAMEGLNKLIPKRSGITLMQTGRPTAGGRIPGVGSTKSGNRGFLLIPNP